MRRNRSRRHFQMSPADYVFDLKVSEAITLARLEGLAAGRPFSKSEFSAMTGAPPGLLSRFKRDGFISEYRGRYQMTEAGGVAASTARSAVRANPAPSFGHPAQGFGRSQYPYDDFEEDEQEFGPPRRWGRW